MQNPNTTFEAILLKLKQSELFDEILLRNPVSDTSEEVALKMLARFYITLSESIQAIETGLRSSDNESVWKACHKVAGTSELLGFKKFGNHSRTLSKTLHASTDYSMYQDEIRLYLATAGRISSLISAGFPDLRSFL